MIKRLWDNFKSWPDRQRLLFLWATVPGLVGSTTIVMMLLSVYFSEFLDEINEILAPVAALIGFFCSLLYPISFIILILFPFIYWKRGWRQALSPFIPSLIYVALHYFTHAYLMLYLIYWTMRDAQV